MIICPLTSCCFGHFLLRYGPKSFDRYKMNLQMMCQRLSQTLPCHCLFVWLTTMPVGRQVHGGFLLKELNFYNEVLRWDATVGNFFACQVMVDYDFDVLDMHHEFTMQTELRMKDGIHWNNFGHRRMTQILLTHICEAWHIRLPRVQVDIFDMNMNQVKPMDRQHWRGELDSLMPVDNRQRGTARRAHQRSVSCHATIRSRFHH